MTKPTDMEVRGFIAVIESLNAIVSLVPESQAGMVLGPLSNYVKEFSARYNISLTIEGVAALAIEHYEKHPYLPAAAEKLHAWKNALNMELLEQEVNDFDEDLWGSAFTDG